MANQNLPPTLQGLCPSPHSNSYLLTLHYPHIHLYQLHFILGIWDPVFVSHVFCVGSRTIHSHCSEYAPCMYFMLLCTPHTFEYVPSFVLHFEWRPEAAGVVFGLTCAATVGNLPKAQQAHRYSDAWMPLQPVCA